MRTATHLLIETVYLFAQIRSRGITGNRNREIATPPHLALIGIITLIKAINDPHQPDAIHIIDRRALPVVAHARRVTGKGKNIAHAQRMGTHEIPL